MISLTEEQIKRMVVNLNPLFKDGMIVMVSASRENRAYRYLGEITSSVFAPHYLVRVVTPIQGEGFLPGDEYSEVEEFLSHVTTEDTPALLAV